jgi:excisionase family DNA binding protein
MKPSASKKTQLLRIDQVADILNCSRRSIYRLVAECELEALKIRGSMRITSCSVGLYIKRQISLFQENNGIRTVIKD